MCLVLDTNRFSVALADPTNKDHLPLMKWVTSKDGLVVFGGKKYAAEIRANRAATKFFAERVRAGQAQRLDDRVVDAEAARVKAMGVCNSNDEHIVALARVSGARVVCTDDDRLMLDIRNPTLLSKPRGRIYKRAEHEPLLHHDARCAKPVRKKKKGRPKGTRQ